MTRGRRRSPNWFGLWLDSMALAAETQTVIALRLTKLATGGAKAKHEAARMIAEKIPAMLDVQRRVAASALKGNGAQAYGQTVRLYRQKVRANRKCLSRPR